jgi:hypothetical protein
LPSFECRSSADKCENDFLAKFRSIAGLERLGIIKLKQLVHAVLILWEEKGIDGLINQPPGRQCANPVLEHQADVVTQSPILPDQIRIWIQIHPHPPNSFRIKRATKSACIP